MKSDNKLIYAHVINTPVILKWSIICTNIISLLRRKRCHAKSALWFPLGNRLLSKTPCWSTPSVHSPLLLLLLASAEDVQAGPLSAAGRQWASRHDRRCTRRSWNVVTGPSPCVGECWVTRRVVLWTAVCALQEWSIFAMGGGSNNKGFKVKCIACCWTGVKYLNAFEWSSRKVHSTKTIKRVFTFCDARAQQPIALCFAEM